MQEPFTGNTYTTAMDQRYLGANGQATHLAILSHEECNGYVSPFPHGSCMDGEFPDVDVTMHPYPGPQLDSYGMGDLTSMITNGPTSSMITNDPASSMTTAINNLALSMTIPNDPAPSLDASPSTQTAVMDTEEVPQSATITGAEPLCDTEHTHDTQKLEIIHHNSAFPKKNRPRPKPKILDQLKKRDIPKACYRCSKVIKKKCDHGLPSCGACMKAKVACQSVEQKARQQSQAENSDRAKLKAFFSTQYWRRIEEQIEKQGETEFDPEFDPELLPVIDPTGLAAERNNGDEGGSNDGGHSDEDQDGDVEMKMSMGKSVIVGFLDWVVRLATKSKNALSPPLPPPRRRRRGIPRTRYIIRAVTA
ncbi:hypothetical protein BC938DRAFT_483391 [Jimgerdemannia flammicorona]|uniref:Zn(2)-C6 fungal-type domain-containing protein n=1 Tax=Jimgerdemannia flammicorona TaxID=994334 RepID=A0A433QC02_9FUNG|nr:hypothetical protein BC938DRAFT_483391 [Jimgerdemannia flammicorona]